MRPSRAKLSQPFVEFSDNYVYFKSSDGLGCVIEQLESAFAFCKAHEKAHLLIDLRNNPYLDDPSANAFEVFFKPVRSRKPAITTNPQSIDELVVKHDLKSPSVFASAKEGLWKGDQSGLTKALNQISKGKGLSQKLVPSDVVLNNLNKYKSIFFHPDKYIIGIHARFGNNENNWAKLPDRLSKKSKHVIFNKVNAYLSSLSKLQKRVGIFVCSDTESFIKEVKHKYDNVICIDRFFLDEGAGASLGGDALNKKNKNDSIQKIENHGRMRVGVEALTDMFLLKECDFLFRTPSSFSVLAVNSGIPTLEVKVQA